MNIFLDKSLPKRTQLLLQTVRIVLLILFFGSLFYASVNPLAGDILLYSSLVLVMIFFAIKIIFERKRKRMVTEELPDRHSAVQGSDTTKMQ